MKTNHLVAIGCFLLILLTSFTTKKTIRVFMIGDSTMADKSLNGGNPERGWGHMLPGFFTEDVVVSNHAQNGRSSKSFIDEGRWDNVIADLQPGDYVFIQFGHNDSKPDVERFTDPQTTYKENLHQFIRETRSKGGIPVLFTSIVRRNFNEEGKLIDTHGDYIPAVREVAEETGVVLIDLNVLTHELVEGLGVEKSKELFVWIEKNTLPCCPEGKQDNTHLNIEGGRTVAALAVDAFQTLLPELYQYVRKFDFVVAKDGSGDFITVQEAVNAVPDYRKAARTIIGVRKGIYEEKVIVPESKINVYISGENGAVLSYGDFASDLNIFGEEKSTSGSASCYVYAPNFMAENITFQNTAGPVGQAVAILVKGDRAVFRNCRFLGFQDTLYTFGQGRQYYEDCYIEGSVDFIFGGATVVFNRCEIRSLLDGYVTAPSTPEGKSFGYVFLDCRLTAAPGVEKVYLSRPWRDYAQAVFIRCELGGHILPVGWHNWNKPDAGKTVHYAEFGSFGEGASSSSRASFSRQLKVADEYTIESILAGPDDWNPLTDSPFSSREN